MIVKGQKTESMFHAAQSDFFFFLNCITCCELCKKKSIIFSDKHSAHATNIKHTFNKRKRFNLNNNNKIFSLNNPQ